VRRRESRPTEAIAGAIASVVTLEDEPRTIVVLSYAVPVRCLCASCATAHGGQVDTEVLADRILGEIVSN